MLRSLHVVYLFIFALLALSSKAAPTVALDEIEPAGLPPSALADPTNAQLLAAGVKKLNKPKRLYDASKTNALKPRASGTSGVQSAVIQVTSTLTKRDSIAAQYLSYDASTYTMVVSDTPTTFYFDASETALPLQHIYTLDSTGAPVYMMAHAAFNGGSGVQSFGDGGATYASANLDGFSDLSWDNTPSFHAGVWNYPGAGNAVSASWQNPDDSVTPLKLFYRESTGVLIIAKSATSIDLTTYPELTATWGSA